MYYILIIFPQIKGELEQEKASGSSLKSELDLESGKVHALNAELEQEKTNLNAIKLELDQEKVALDAMKIDIEQQKAALENELAGHNATKRYFFSFLSSLRCTVYTQFRNFIGSKNSENQC